MSIKIQLNSLEALEKLFSLEEGKEMEFQIKERIIEEFAKKHIKAVIKSYVESGMTAMIQKECNEKIIAAEWTVSGTKHTVKSEVLKSLVEEEKCKMQDYAREYLESAFFELKKEMQADYTYKFETAKKKFQTDLSIQLEAMKNGIAREFDKDKIKEKAIELLNEAFYRGHGLDISEDKEKEKKQ